MIDRAVTAGLAGCWLWVVLNDEDGIAKGLHNVFLTRGFLQKWMECPWCSGAWFAGGMSLLLGRGVPLRAKLGTAVAAACVTGLLGSYHEGS